MKDKPTQYLDLLASAENQDDDYSDRLNQLWYGMSHPEQDQVEQALIREKELGEPWWRSW